MATKTTTFRFREYDLRLLKELAEEMACTQADAVRIALSVLRQPVHHVFRHTKRAEHLGWRLRDRIVQHHGVDELLELYVRADASGAACIGGLEPSDFRVEVRRSDNFVHFDIVDATNEGDPDQIAIRDAWTAEPDEVEDGNSITVRLADLTLYGEQPQYDDLYGGMGGGDVLAQFVAERKTA